MRNKSKNYDSSRLVVNIGFYVCEVTSTRDFILLYRTKKL